MLLLLRVRYLQFLEHWRLNGFWAACRFSLYHKEEEVPVVKDLSDLPPLKEQGEEIQLVEVTPETLPSLAFEYPLRSRRERVGRYLQRGYRGLALVHGGKACGDLWYASQKTTGRTEIHPDVQRFQLDIAEGDVYLFDMHVDQQQRRGGLATFLLSSALHHLQHQGYRRAFGYYSKDNIPALWVHRLLGYRELTHFIVQRFFLYRTTRAKD